MILLGHFSAVDGLFGFYRSFLPMGRPFGYNCMKYEISSPE